ncbi:MAG TPA: hypothetical protein VH561_01980 [Micromonosporaceae bacterium]|jgi:uncharacterized membrane protein YczE
MALHGKATRTSRAEAGTSLPLRIRPVFRLGQLAVGLVAYGVSMGLMVESRLGNMPWDVFHQGLARRTGLSIGTISIIVGAVVLLLWIPLRQRPGIGTVSNVVVIGLAVDAAIWALPTPSPLWARVLYLVAGVLLCAVATGLYVGPRLGPGPRDGLMTGLAARGHSVRVVRTAIEIVVVVVGFLLGGTLGVGTLVYALAIGPLVHITLPLFAIRVPRTLPTRSDPEPEPAGA